jgi:hypothetical protein
VKVFGFRNARLRFVDVRVESGQRGGKFSQIEVALRDAKVDQISIVARRLRAQRIERLAGLRVLPRAKELLRAAEVEREIRQCGEARHRADSGQLSRRIIRLWCQRELEVHLREQLLALGRRRLNLCQPRPRLFRR